MARISNAIVTKVSEMHRDGFPVWKIARELNITEATVVRILGL